MTTAKSIATAKALATALEQRDAVGAALDLAITAMLDYGPLGLQAADGKTVIQHALEARQKAGRTGPLPSIPRVEP